MQISLTQQTRPASYKKLQYPVFSWRKSKWMPMSMMLNENKHQLLHEIKQLLAPLPDDPNDGNLPF